MEISSPTEKRGCHKHTCTLYPAPSAPFALSTPEPVSRPACLSCIQYGRPFLNRDIFCSHSTVTELRHLTVIQCIPTLSAGLLSFNTMSPPSGAGARAQGRQGPCLWLQTQPMCGRAAWSPDLPDAMAGARGVEPLPHPKGERLALAFGEARGLLWGRLPGSYRVAAHPAGLEPWPCKLPAGHLLEGRGWQSEEDTEVWEVKSLLSFPSRYTNSPSQQPPRARRETRPLRVW